MGTWWVSFENLCKEWVLFLTAAAQGTRVRMGVSGCAGLRPPLSSPPHPLPYSSLPCAFIPPTPPSFPLLPLSIPPFLSLSLLKGPSPSPLAPLPLLLPSLHALDVTRLHPQITPTTPEAALHIYPVPRGLICDQSLSVTTEPASPGPELFLTSPVAAGTATGFLQMENQR